MSSVESPVTMSTAFSTTVPRKPRVAPAPAAASSSPRHCNRTGTATAVPARFAPRTAPASPLCERSRSRAFSGCRTSDGPPSMCRMTTSSPGTAVTGTVAPEAARWLESRTECLMRAADPGDERDGRAAARERDFVALAAWHEKRDGRRGPAGYRCHSLAYPRRLSRSSTLRLTMNSMKTSIRPIDA